MRETWQVKLDSVFEMHQAVYLFAIPTLLFLMLTGRGSVEI